jgi:uncharacterized protein (DUF983 family)
MDDAFVPPIRAGLRCRCPRCGDGPLFAGFLSVADRCAACGLDFAKVDSGDGPAVFVIFIVGAAAAALLMYVEFTYGPPAWVHLVYLVPLVLGGALALLRPMKATLIALQFRNRANQEVDIGE